jgi:hypothetical protein
MPWDLFCPHCGNTLEGGMTEDEEQMKKECEALEGKEFLCSICSCSFKIINGESIIQQGPPLHTITKWDLVETRGKNKLYRGRNKDTIKVVDTYGGSNE